MSSITNGAHTGCTAFEIVDIADLLLYTYRRFICDVIFYMRGPWWWQMGLLIIYLWNIMYNTYILLWPPLHTITYTQTTSCASLFYLIWVPLADAFDVIWMYILFNLGRDKIVNTYLGMIYWDDLLVYIIWQFAKIFLWKGWMTLWYLKKVFPALAHKS